MFACAVLCGSLFAAESYSLPGVDCQTAPLVRCDDRCSDGALSDVGNALEPLSGRKFFLDYPCDLKAGDKVLFILNLHGAGSSGAWQRHYFPATALKERYRLVIATPTAATARQIPPIPVDFRVWDSDADDIYLDAIVTFVLDRIGRDNVRAFWIAGHSQGGVTAHRIACGEFFKDKADGVLSLSGGRIGAVTPSRLFLAPPSEHSLDRAPAFGNAIAPACNLSYIFVTGDREVVSLPERSPWAEKYRCAPRIERDRVVDTDAGYVTTDRPEGRPRPHAATIYIYPDCKRAKLVADVFRRDRDHGDGLGPNVTEALVKLMLSAPGGKARERR